MLENIAQLQKLDSGVYQTIVKQVKAHGALETIWQEPYPEYASRGLKVATLLNATGEQENFDYRDCRNVKSTPLLNELSSIKAFFEGSGLDIMGARLLRLDAGTFLHEHRDFIYLEPVPRFRLHLPLITNPDCFIVSPDINVHFKAGYLWKLDPKSTIHSACNFGKAPRIHLMLDCYVNETLAALIEKQFLDEDAKFVKPALTKSIKEDLQEQAINLLQKSADNLTAAEEIILAAFCRYNLYCLKEGLTTYDILSQVYEEAARAIPALQSLLKERQAYWQARLVETYPERKDKEAALAV